MLSADPVHSIGVEPATPTDVHISASPPCWEDTFIELRPRDFVLLCVIWALGYMLAFERGRTTGKAECAHNKSDGWWFDYGTSTWRDEHGYFTYNPDATCFQVGAVAHETACVSEDGPCMCVYIIGIVLILVFWTSLTAIRLGRWMMSDSVAPPSAELREPMRRCSDKSWIAATDVHSEGALATTKKLLTEARVTLRSPPGLAARAKAGLTIDDKISARNKERDRQAELELQGKDFDAASVFQSLFE